MRRCRFTPALFTLALALAVPSALAGDETAALAGDETAAETTPGTERASEPESGGAAAASGAEPALEGEPAAERNGDEMEPGEPAAAGGASGDGNDVDQQEEEPQGPEDNLGPVGRSRIDVDDVVRPPADIPLHANPARQARSFHFARAGEPMTVTEVREHWFRVSTADGWGWIHREDLIGHVTFAHPAMAEASAPEPLALQSPEPPARRRATRDSLDRLERPATPVVAPRGRARMRGTEPERPPLAPLPTQDPHDPPPPPAPPPPDAPRPPAPPARPAAPSMGAAPGDVAGAVSAAQMRVALEEGLEWLQVRSPDGSTSWVRVQPGR